MVDVQSQDLRTNIDDASKKEAMNLLIAKYGETEKFRIEKGINQVAEFWLAEDGSADEFVKFCTGNFTPSGIQLKSLYDRIEFFNEITFGYFTEMSVKLRQPLDLEMGDIQPVDLIMGSFNPSAHLTDDLFKNKYAFIVLLNFPRYSLEERTQSGMNWNRQEWAYARLGSMFNARISADINQKVNDAYTAGDNYISNYNIVMNKLVDDDMKSYFPEGLKLITHWGLRDELKARYSTAGDLPKQEMIYQVMQRIIRQEIPAKVINKEDYQWNPFSNKIYKNGSEERGAEREQDERYQMLLNNFKANKLLDDYFPGLNTHMKRSFDLGREVSEKEVEDMFVQMLKSPQVKKVAGLVKSKLGRDLKPFDIWFTGFRSKSKIDEAELDKIVKSKYPTVEAFENDIDNIMLKLGFSNDIAEFVAEKITVDNSRGAGHAIGAAIKEFKARLRTRIGKDGMTYKGFNIAVHELGHCVEQTLTLYKMDYYTLNGVPNTSFTEAFAFVFQGRDLELLGIKNEDPLAEDLKALDIFWSTYEIMGVSLVDMKVWNWLYANPGCTPAELKEAVIDIAKDVWNKYYADVFGIKDAIILGVYSHMIDNPLYLPNYALGHLIQFQIEDYLKNKTVGPEMQRMCASGNIIPQVWMQNAVGSAITVKPLLDAVDEALTRIK
jgi:hypothetical protein